MKTWLRLLAAVFALIAINSVRATDFVSQVVQANATFTITVPADRFLVIKNFTQEGTSDPGLANTVTLRGIITVTDRTGLTGTVITATIAELDPTVLLEPVNDVVIGGGSTVTVNGGNTNCFLTYRKGDN